MADDKDQDDDELKASGPEGEGEEGGEGDKKLSRKKLILFIAVPLLVLIGAGAGLYFSGMLDKLLGGGGEEHATAEAEGGHGKAAGGEHGEGVATGPAFLAIPDMIVNLSSTDAQPRYLRLKVQLEMQNQADLAAVEQVLPRVVDQFQTYLRELRVKDLRGSAGIYRLQMELLARVNAAAYPVEVKDVLFQEILIQ